MNGPSGGVRIAARAERDLDGMPDQVATACLAFVLGPLADNPLRLGGALAGRLVGLRSVRRGTYRVLYRIDEKAALIEIVHIEHRSSASR